MTSVTHCKPFSQIRSSDVAEAGGKGASLGEMTQAGFGVPEGFVICASAYEQFLQTRQLQEDIQAQLQHVNLDDMNSVEKASVTIQDMIHDVPLSEEMQQEFLEQFDALGATFVAVRSSATAEDSQVASWAGELETYLNTTRDTYLEQIKKCWASLFSPRAIFYRCENALQDAQVHVAVVIQKMVNADVAGVCFTVHPVTEDRNQMIIEAGFGLGEALVSGQITPDSYIIAKDSLECIDRYTSTQTLKIIRNEQGQNETIPLNENEGSQPKLADGQITRIAQEAKKIEAHYGFPVDIEWAIEGENLFMTQARPITTLK